MQVVILIGTKKKQKEYLDQFQKENSIPSYFTLIYDQFKILDARNLQKTISLKLKENEKRLIIISSPTPDSQQALLKTVEELSLQNYLFFLVSSPEDLLPTIRSRCKILFLQQEEADIDVLLEEKIRGLLEKGSLGNLMDSFGAPVELADFEKTLLVFRKIIIEDAIKNNLPNGKLFKVLKSLHVNYKLCKSNNINKRLALEISLL